MSSNEDKLEDVLYSDSYSVDSEIQNFEIRVLEKIQKYFSSNDYFTEESLPNFLNFVGLGEWKSENELQCLWSTFSKYAKNGKVDFEGCKTGLFDFIFNQDEEFVRTSCVGRLSMNAVKRFSNVNLEKNNCENKKINNNNNCKNNYNNNENKTNEKKVDNNISEKENNENLNINLYKEINYQKNFDVLINENEPEVIRKIVCLFNIMKLGIREEITSKEIENIIKANIYLQIEYNLFINFFMHFSEIIHYDNLIYTFKINEDKYNKINVKLNGIIEEYKDSFVKMKKNIFGESTEAFYFCLEDIIQCEKESEVYPNILLSGNNICNKYLSNEIIFLSEKRQNNLENLRLYYIKLLDKIKQFKEEINTLNMKISDFDENKDKKDFEIEDIKNECRKFQNEINIQNQIINDLKKEINEKENSNNDLTRVLNEEKLKNKNLNNQIIELNLEIQQSKKNYDSLLNDVIGKINKENEQKKIEEEERQKRLIKKNMGVNNNLNSNFEEDDLNEENKIINYEKKIIKAPGKVEGMTHEEMIEYTSKIDKDNEILVNKISILEKKLKEMEKCNKTYEEKFKNYEDKFNLYRDENVKLKNENEKLNDEKRDLKEELDNYKKDVNSLNLNDVINEDNNQNKSIKKVLIVGNSFQKNYNNLEQLNNTNINNQENLIKQKINLINTINNENNTNIQNYENCQNDINNLNKYQEKSYSCGVFTNNQQNKENILKPLINQDIIKHNLTSNADILIENYSNNLITNAVRTCVIKGNDGELYTMVTTKDNTTQLLSMDEFNHHYLNSVSSFNSDDNGNNCDSFSKMENNNDFMFNGQKDIKNNQNKSNTNFAFLNNNNNNNNNNNDNNNHNYNNSNNNNNNDNDNVNHNNNNNNNKNNKNNNNNNNKNTIVSNSNSKIQNNKNINSTISKNNSNPNPINITTNNNNITNINIIGNNTINIKSPKNKLFSTKINNIKKYSPFSFAISPAGQMMDGQSHNELDYVDDVYLIEGQKYNKTKVILNIFDNMFWIQKSKNENFDLCYPLIDICKIHIAETNENILAIEFNKSDQKTFIIETYRRMTLLKYLRMKLLQINSNKNYFISEDTFNLKKNSEFSLLLINNVLKFYPNLDGAEKFGYLYRLHSFLKKKKFVLRLVVLTNIGILVFEDPLNPPEKFIPLVNINIIDKKGLEKPCAFELQCFNKESNIFGADNEDYINGWKKAIMGIHNKYVKGVREVLKFGKKNNNGKNNIDNQNNQINLNYNSNTKKPKVAMFGNYIKK